MNLPLKKGLKEVIFFFQKFLFYFSKIMTFWILNKNEEKRVIIGKETANLLNLYSKLFNCYSINTHKSKYYNNSYSLPLSNFPALVRYIILPIIYPIVLKKFSSIWYFSSGSFFLSNDGREWEFKIAKSNGLKIICFYMGADIRSLKLIREHSESIDLDHWSNYISDESIIDRSDQRSKVYSSASNRYAHAIFNCEKDQASYINKNHMIPLPVSRNKYLLNTGKWGDTSTIKILHSPSSPINKGTQIVMSAIKKLQMENYKFDFKFLSGVPQSKVLKELDEAHIALNEFYAYVPGLFGVEALEANCLLLTSASKKYEPSLFNGCDYAWVPTMYYQIYDHLKYYLDNIDQAKIQADKGTIWAKKFCSHEASIDYVNSIVKP